MSLRATIWMSQKSKWLESPDSHLLVFLVDWHKSECLSEEDLDMDDVVQITLLLTIKT